MKRYNVGIIGYGWVSTAHIAAINATSLAQVTAIQSSRPQDPTALSARHGGAITVFRDQDEMLADPGIHAVSICSYPQLHAEHIVRAARAGKHLIIEKPITLTVSEMLQVASAVTAAGVKTCVCFECRFSNQITVTKSVIESGLLGPLHYGEIDYYHGIGPWYGQYRWNTTRAAGGSSLLSAGCHALDALLFCMGGEVESVTSLATRSSHPDFARYEYPTTSVTLLRFANGALGKVASVIDCQQPYYFHTHLVGSHGALLDDKFHSTQLNADRKGWSTLSMKLLDSGDVADHPYRTQFEAFFSALSRGEDMPRTSLREALKSHEVVLAADHSAANGGKPIVMREFGTEEKSS